jgi:hypothetical protein
VRLLEYFEPGVRREKRLHQFEKYAIDVYGVPQAFFRLSDGRHKPSIPTFGVINSLLHAAVLRIPSLNQLEQMLTEPDFQCLLGYRPRRDRKPVFSADTMADVLDTVDITGLEGMVVDIVQRAERNKAFRDDTFGTFRCAALDGWEPFCTYKRHCKGCLTRQVKRTVEDEDGNEVTEMVTQYYHRFVVAFLIAPKLDLTLAIEPVRSEDVRIHKGEDEGCGHEGELTAALRLIDRIHSMYGRFIDAFALDGLYPCGPIMSKLAEYRYGAFIVTRNKKKDPYRFAESIWQTRDKPDDVQQDPTGEITEFWELDDVDTLKTFDGSVRMLKAQVTRKNGKKSTWAMAMVGKAKHASRSIALRILRSRWHIENTAFHQWVTKWNLDHCYRHTPNAITAVMLIWSVAFNLMQLFFYRRLGKPRTGRKVTDTLQAMVALMLRELGTFTVPVPWDALADSS